jgi:hypothetical protein
LSITQFKVDKLYILPTQIIYVFMDLIIYIVFFLSSTNWLYNGDRSVLIALYELNLSISFRFIFISKRANKLVSIISFSFPHLPLYT